MTSKVCRYCQERHYKCHSTCERYIEETNALREKRAEEPKQRMFINDINEVLIFSKNKKR